MSEHGARQFILKFWMDAANHHDYLNNAYTLARECSRDPRTQNAALLVNPANGEILVASVNNFPRGVDENLTRWEKPLKHSYVEHAERNAIYEAARKGIKTEGLVLYAPWFACDNCARAIIQSRIGCVIGHDALIHRQRPDWAESIRIADGMLTESGTLFKRIQGTFPDVTIRFDDQLVHPH